VVVSLRFAGVRPLPRYLGPASVYPRETNHGGVGGNKKAAPPTEYHLPHSIQPVEAASSLGV